VHPEKKQKRKVKIGKRFFISMPDYERLKGKEIRLLHLCNILLSPLANGKARAVFTSRENKDLPRIQWASNYVDADIKMPNADIKRGFAEEAVLKLKQDSVIQFERFGFCRLDKKTKSKAEFWFSHE
jgi:glutamyl-tRNA synthetase